ncbi:hypothetical protein [Nocardioides nanhaiensis]|uniref:Uncharacterized protein n=1 Tax=Nocardioides nanhaiensis TaxID=1476871 RepID=A0ABP8W1H8_9ACTN
MRTAARRTTATLGAAALLASPLALLTAAPAAAADRDFRYAGAQVDFEVEKDDRRLEVSVDVDDARPGERFRIVLRQNGRVFVNRVFRADREGDIEIDRNRPDTRGRDTVRLTIKKVGNRKAASRVIRVR